MPPIYAYKPDPAPSIIDGVEWLIRDSGNPRQAYVDFRSKTMVVPMDDSDASRIVRAHEATHVKITPRGANAIPKEIPNRTAQAVEDCRVYSSMKRSGIEAMDVELWTPEEVEQFPTVSDLEKVRALVATRGTGDRAVLEALVDPELVELVNGVVEPVFAPAESRGEIPTWDEAMGVCRALQEALREREETQPEPDQGEGEKGEGEGAGEPEPSVGDSSESDEGEPKPSSESEAKQEARDEKESRETKRSRSASAPYRLDKTELPLDPKQLTEEETNLLTSNGINPNRGTADSAELYEIALPLTEKLSVKDGYGKRKTSTDTGAIPRNMHRLTIDSQVFSKTKRQGTATILIDCSGSMHLSPEEILEFLKIVPSALVAGYSGDTHGTRGALCVFAKDRKAINAEHLREFQLGRGLNAVDRPALEWLEKRHGPRLWICDGVVTGQRDDKLSASELVKIGRVVRRARIHRVRSIDSALDYLKAGRLR